MRKLTLFAMAAMLLVCTQCKKNDATEGTKTIQITFTPTENASRTEFDPSGSFAWTENECIFVGGSNHADCLGVLSSVGSGESITFNGEIAQPEEGETLHFFYLGNGKDNSEMPTELVFSTQDGQNVANYHVARGSQTYSEGMTSFNATLDMLVSFAYLDLSAFKDGNNAQENVYLHGEAVYSKATVNYSEGTITGTPGYINLGKAVNGGGYYALIPQTTPAATTVKFESNSKTGTMNFLRGIEAAKLYRTNEGALVPTMGELRENAGGLFSVSDTKMVRMAKSNLQYTRTSTAEDWANGTWSFMENPWDYVETTGTIGDEYADQTAISLFGWGTSGNQMAYYGRYYYPWATANTMNSVEQQYGPRNSTSSLTDEYANGDWGINNNGDLGGEQPSWRVLTKDEWLYLFGMTEDNQDSEGHKRFQKYGRAKINGYSASSGIIIVPDDFNDPQNNQNSPYGEFVGGTATEWTSNYYNGLANWNQMDNAGAIFLPISGYRDGDEVKGWHQNAFYQSSTVYNGNFAHQLRFSGNSIDPANHTYRRYIGMSVRLVMDLD